jgi:hypothetical protein
MPLELESYLNVLRISEIELFPGAPARFTYVISWDGCAAVHRMHYSVADAPRPFLVPRDIVTSRVWRNFLRLPPPSTVQLTRGTFRVFMIRIRDATGDETLVRVIKAFSLSPTRIRSEDKVRNSAIMRVAMRESPGVRASKSNPSPPATHSFLSQKCHRNVKMPVSKLTILNTAVTFSLVHFNKWILRCSLRLH